MKRIGIFGGSFDPVHCGHLGIARAAMKELKLDRVFFVPARISPLKRVRLHPPRHRIRMLRLAVGKNPKFKVSDFDVKAPGPSYSVRTLAYFHRRYPASRLFFLLGSDSLLTFRKWKKWKKILELCTLAVLRRRGGKKIPSRLLINLGPRVQILKSQVPEVSSTEIREGFFNPANVPQKVRQYIIAKWLYPQWKKRY